MVPRRSSAASFCTLWWLGAVCLPWISFSRVGGAAAKKIPGYSVIYMYVLSRIILLSKVWCSTNVVKSSNATNLKTSIVAKTKTHQGEFSTNVFWNPAFMSISLPLRCERGKGGGGGAGESLVARNSRHWKLMEKVFEVNPLIPNRYQSVSTSTVVWTL